ncbi:hypothetical protein D3C77_755320 [compost metagenome]
MGVRRCTDGHQVDIILQKLLIVLHSLGVQLELLDQLLRFFYVNISYRNDFAAVCKP